MTCSDPRCPYPAWVRNPMYHEDCKQRGEPSAAPAINKQEQRT